MWKVGHPVVFPAMLRVGPTFQVRVPMDDTHTLHIHYIVYRPGIPIPPQASVPVYEVPLYDEHGKVIIDYVLAQDMFAWETQGAIADRSQEHLGQSDVGIIMYRELLLEQMDKAARGEPLMEVYRDPAQNVCVNLPQERDGVASGASDPQVAVYVGAQGVQTEEILGPVFKELDQRMWELHREAEAHRERGEPMLPETETTIVPVGYQDHKSVTIMP